MLRELLSIFRAGNPLEATAEEFSDMLEQTRGMTVAAGEIFFSRRTTPEERSRIYKQDVKVNKAERRIRKHVVAHLTVGGNSADLPFCLMLMSLVKDVERIGDYAKNLSEIIDVYTGALPDDEIVADLREIRAGTEEALRVSSRVLAESDRESAFSLINQLKDLAKRADGLLSRIAQSSYDAPRTVSMVLATRYYKRIGGHVLNLLSSVVMPLHKIDYYDEDEAQINDEGSTS